MKTRASVCLRSGLNWLLAAVIILLGAVGSAFWQADNFIDPNGGQIGPTEAAQGSYNQQSWWVPMQEASRSITPHLLEARVYRPAGTGPFPLVTINHGAPRPGTDVQQARPGFAAAARWFVRRGFAVVVPMRRGYGHSGGMVQ